MSLSIPGATRTPTTHIARDVGLSPFEQIALAMAAPANDDALINTVAVPATPPAALLEAIAAATGISAAPPSDPSTIGAPPAQTDVVASPSLYELFLEARTAIRASTPHTVPPALAPLIAAAPPAPETRAVSEIVAAIAASLAAQSDAQRAPGFARVGDRSAGRVSPIRAMSGVAAAGDRNA